MRQGQGFLLVYSVTDRSSFEEIQSFYNEVFRVKEDDQPKNHKIPIIIVGNKADLGKENNNNVTNSMIIIIIPADSARQVPSSEGQDFARKLGCQFLETSAKTRQGVEEVLL